MALVSIADRAIEWLVVPSFTRTGYALRRRMCHWRSLSSYDLSDRVALVTGATSGIGFAAAEALARMGAHVIVLGRDPRRTDAAVHDLRSRTGSERFSMIVASMDDPAAVRAAAAEVATRHARLDILVHNAGALAVDYRLAPYGGTESRPG